MNSWIAWFTLRASWSSPSPEAICPAALPADWANPTYSGKASHTWYDTTIHSNPSRMLEHQAGSSRASFSRLSRPSMHTFSSSCGMPYTKALLAWLEWLPTIDAYFTKWASTGANLPFASSAKRRLKSRQALPRLSSGISTQIALVSAVLKPMLDMLLIKSAT